MQVNQGKLNNPLFHAWLKAGAEMGHAVRDDFNSEHQEGFGVFDQTISRGKRFSTARGYLHPVKQRKNLTIIPKAMVRKIRFSHDSQGKQTRAEAIDVIINGKQQTIKAGTKIILCTGAINTPQLMLLSGIGDSAQLDRHGISVQHHLPGVGKNLQDHLETYVQFSCKKPVSIFPALKWYNQPAIGIEWYLRQTGAGATNHFETGAFLRSRPELKQPDLQYHFLPIAMNYDGSDKHNGHGFQFHVGPMKPTSRGEVSLNSSNPADAPKINFNYNATQEDQDTIRRGVEIARQIAKQDAFAEYVDTELNPGSIDIDTFVRNNSHSAYHPSCSCKMGSDNMAVVDGQANVHGIDNLSIVDASIMPDITNGNLNAPVIMMAEKLADVILGNEALTS
jgi:choline dehydrogenase